MLVSSLVPPPEGRAEFSYAAWRDTPKESGCYALAAFGGEVLYVGQSVNIRRRMEQHLDGDEMRKATPFGVAFWMHYKLWPVANLDNLERGWMNQHKLQEKGKLPFFNKADAPT